MKCDRCGKDTLVSRMSWFNTDIICPDCIKKEEKHPLYQYAKDVEHIHVLNGDLNYKGIGYPGENE